MFRGIGTQNILVAIVMGAVSALCDRDESGREAADEGREQAD